MPNVECSTPNGAFYVFPDFQYYIGSKTKNGEIIRNSKDLCLYFLSETGVVSVDGDSFGAPNYIRFSYATSEETIKKAMDLILNVLKKLSF